MLVSVREWRSFVERFWQGGSGKGGLGKGGRRRTSGFALLIFLFFSFFQGTLEEGAKGPGNSWVGK